MTVLLIKVVFGDKKLDNTTCVPDSSSESKQIASHEGYMLNYDNGVSFTYLEGGK